MDTLNIKNTQYFKTKEEFDEAVGMDFITHANQETTRGREFLVGLAHGQSPSGAYQYILAHFSSIKRPELLRFTFTNSRLKRQRGLEDVLDARAFLRELYTQELIAKDQILGRSLNREDLEAYLKEYNAMLSAYLKKHQKEGLDYVFIAADPTGLVAGISRNSTAFGSQKIGVVVQNRREKELTVTPHFLGQSKRIAFLATKADKRRSLAFLFYRWAKANKSPGFLRYIDKVEERMVVFIDDKALTWPQIEVTRETAYGPSVINIDVAKPYNENAKKKQPVILLVHGFLGLNSYDALLISIAAHKYIAAAMHYGSIPDALPPSEYSRHVVGNIDAVVSFFGSKGHPVYIFDHSISNIYFLMIDRDFEELAGIKKYLRGRIGANPFFGEEAKHALMGFLKHVLIPSKQGPAETIILLAARSIIPWDTKKRVRERGIQLSDWLISKDSTIRDRIWQAAKEQISFLMTNLASLPQLNRIPIERALNRLPAKVFAIQVRSALAESKTFDRQKGLINTTKHDIPVLILKSDKDAVAKFVTRIYENSHAEIVDVTNSEETDLFREHLYHMVNPPRTALLIEQFIEGIEEGYE